VGDCGAQDILRIAAGIDMELGVVLARSRHDHVRQRLQPASMPVPTGRQPDRLPPGGSLHLAGRPCRHDPAMVDDRDRLAELLGHVELMGAEDERLPSIAQLQERGLEERDIDWVKAHERLVHEDDVRVVQHRRDELDLLLIPFGQALGLAVCELAHPEAPKPVERGRPGCAARDAIQGGEEDELLEDRHAQVQAALLRHVAPRSARPGSRLAILPGDGALVGMEKAEGNPHRRGLARAVGAEEAEDFAGANAERHPVERLDLAEAFAQAVDLEHNAMVVPKPCHGQHPNGPIVPGLTDLRAGAGANLRFESLSRLLPRGRSGSPRAAGRRSAGRGGS
jgi:hypothetical protein